MTESATSRCSSTVAIICFRFPYKQSVAPYRVSRCSPTSKANYPVIDGNTRYRSYQGSNTRWCQIQGGDRMSTSLTDTTISGKRPVEDPCCSRKRSEDRLSTVDYYKDRLPRKDSIEGPTRRRVPRKLEEEYRGRNRLQESNRGRIDYRSRS